MPSMRPVVASAAKRPPSVVTSTWVRCARNDSCFSDGGYQARFLTGDSRAVDFRVARPKQVSRCLSGNKLLCARPGTVQWHEPISVYSRSSFFVRHKIPTPDLPLVFGSGMEFGADMKAMNADEPRPESPHGGGVIIRDVIELFRDAVDFVEMRSQRPNDIRMRDMASRMTQEASAEPLSPG